MTRSIVGLDKAESDVILNYLYDVYEKVSKIMSQSTGTLSNSRRTSTFRFASSGLPGRVHFGTTGESRENYDPDRVSAD